MVAVMIVVVVVVMVMVVMIAVVVVEVVMVVVVVVMIVVVVEVEVVMVVVMIVVVGVEVGCSWMRHHPFFIKGKERRALMVSSQKTQHPHPSPPNQRTFAVTPSGDFHFPVIEFPVSPLCAKMKL
ncbi:unnamed protein product [Lota lota]